MPEFLGKEMLTGTIRFSYEMLEKDEAKLKLANTIRKKRSLNEQIKNVKSYIEGRRDDLRRLHGLEYEETLELDDYEDWEEDDGE